MGAHVFISHSAADAELAHGISDFLGGAVPGLEVACSSLPGRVPSVGEDSLAALKQKLGDAGVVLALITPTALGSGEVPFQLGAAWAQGKPLTLLLHAEGSAEGLYLPMAHAESLALGPDSLIELARGLAEPLELKAELTEAGIEALGRLYPDWEGLDRKSGERPVTRPPEPSISETLPEPLRSPTPPPAGDEAHAAGSDEAPDAAAAPDPSGTTETTVVSAAPPPPSYAGPSRESGYRAGRAFADCVYHREEGGTYATELDDSFGSFVAGLGGNWAALRELEDLDVWMETADNLLEGLSPAEEYLRGWYEVGFQLSTLLNLAQEAEDGIDADAELHEAWDAALELLRQMTCSVGVSAAELQVLEGMLQNLGAPEAERDYTLVARVQSHVDDLVRRADGA
ncbi:MAG: hypothetical protein PVI30_03425 [Myxococcales bacterium]|jgi:hypothetical protein